MTLVGEDPDRLAEGRELEYRDERRAGNARVLRVAASRRRPHGLLVRFEGVDSREQAQRLTGGELWVRFDPAEVAPGEYYAHQLEGLRVRTVGGVEVGRIAGVIFGPGRAFLEVRDPGGATRLVPFHEDIVKTVDEAGGLVTIDPPEGLLEL